MCAAKYINYGTGITTEEARLNIGQYVEKVNGKSLPCGAKEDIVIDVYAHPLIENNIPTYAFNDGSYVEARRCKISEQFFNPKWCRILAS